MLNKLFKPKWQHEDAQIRLAAIAELESADEGLIALADNDENLNVRLTAIEKLEDDDALFAIANRDGPAAYAGISRLIELSQTRPLTIESNTIAVQIDPSEHDVSTLLASQEASIRATAMQLPLDDSLLFELASTDNDKNIRQTAVSRMHDETLLKSLIKQYKGKDKSLFRLAQTQLESIEAQAANEQQIVTLIAQINALPKQAGHIAEAKLKTLIHQFKQQNAITEAQQTAYDQARSNAETYIATWQTEQAALAPHIEARQALIAQAKGAIDAIQDAQEDIPSPADLHAAWLSLTPIADETMLRTEFDDALESLHAQFKTYAQNKSRLTALQKQLDTLGKEYDRPLPRTSQLEALTQTFKNALRPTQSEALVQIEHDFNRLLNQAQQKIESVKDAAKTQHSEIKSGLETLKTALQSDDTQTAESTYKTLKNLIETAAISDKERQNHLHDLNQFLPELRQLQSWRSFGARQVREELIEKAKSLLTSPLTGDKLAKEVSQLRNDWKSLNTHDHAGSRALWEEFNAICNRVYAQCEQDFDEQAARQATSLKRREAICIELEDIVENTDWSHVDWRELDKKLRHIRDAWKKTGAVHRKDWQNIADRFHKALRAIDEHLQPERKRNKIQREKLIEEVNVLTEQEDAHAAIEQVKALQSKWQVTVSSHPRVEKELWEKFKTAQDAVFNKRRAQNKAHRAEVDSHIKARDEILVQMHTLASLPPAEALERKLEVIKLEETWSSFDDIPVKVAKEQDKKLTVSKKQFAALLTQAKRNQTVDELKKLMDYIEHGGEMPVFVNKSWREAIMRIASAEVQHKRLVEMEWLLKLDSPEADTDLRNQIQMEMLQNALSQKGQTDVIAQAIALFEAYCLEYSMFTDNPSDVQSTPQMDMLSADADTSNMNKIPKDIQSRLHAIFQKIVESRDA